MTLIEKFFCKRNQRQGNDANQRFGGVSECGCLELATVERTTTKGSRLKYRKFFRLAFGCWLRWHRHKRKTQSSWKVDFPVIITKRAHWTKANILFHQNLRRCSARIRSRNNNATWCMLAHSQPSLIFSSFHLIFACLTNFIEIDSRWPHRTEANRLVFPGKMSAIAYARANANICPKVSRWQIRFFDYFSLTREWWRWRWTSGDFQKCVWESSMWNRQMHCRIAE